MSEEPTPPSGDPFAQVLSAISALAEAIANAISALIAAVEQVIITLVHATSPDSVEGEATVLPLDTAEEKETEQNDTQ